MSDDAPSFVRGIFAGDIHDALLFPFPAPLNERDPEETRTVRRLLSELERMAHGLIDSQRFDQEEIISDDVIRALADAGWLGISIPREYGGSGLSLAAYAHVLAFAAARRPSSYTTAFAFPPTTCSAAWARDSASSCRCSTRAA